jgi:glycosyltransferase involved in cell wall biosynthesis
MALAEQMMLARYITGLPTRRDLIGPLGRWLFPGKVGAYSIELEQSLVSHVYIATLVRKAAAAICRPKLAATAAHRADGLFDWYVSGVFASSKPEAVVAYENSALMTFRRAKRLGIKTILDAAGVHHRWQDRFSDPPQSSAAHRRTIARKDAEIALADEILTVSSFARESYLDAGVPPARVHAVPVGVDSSAFKPRTGELPLDPVAANDFRFVYVGNAAPLKGLDVLTDAVRRLRQHGQRCTVTLIGAGEPPGANETIGIQRIGWMSHARLTSELPRHNVLVLPSYFDSFGMVVAEAMACGLPVIVTENVGAKEMVTPEVTGRVVPAGDAEALASAMRWFIANREMLPEMARAARLAAERYDWSHYRRRIVAFFQSL